MTTKIIMKIPLLMTKRTMITMLVIKKIHIFKDNSDNSNYDFNNDVNYNAEVDFGFVLSLIIVIVLLNIL